MKQYAPVAFIQLLQKGVSWQTSVKGTMQDSAHSIQGEAVTV